jgi:hypothetical protein
MVETKLLDLEIHTTHTAHSTAARRHAAGASVFLRHFGHMASFSGGASAQVNCYAKCGATEGGRSWAVRAGPQGIERLVNSRAALLAGELIEHGVDPLLRRYIRSFLRWGCRHAGRRQLVGAKKSIADQQQ